MLHSGNIQLLATQADSDSGASLLPQCTPCKREGGRYALAMRGLSDFVPIEFHLGHALKTLKL